MSDLKTTTIKAKINICEALMKVDARERYLNHHKAQGAVHPDADSYADSIEIWKQLISGSTDRP